MNEDDNDKFRLKMVNILMTDRQFLFDHMKNYYNRLKINLNISHFYVYFYTLCNCFVLSFQKRERVDSGSGKCTLIIFASDCHVITYI